MPKKVINLYHTSWATYARDFQITDLMNQIKNGATDVSYSFFNLNKKENGDWEIKSGDEWSDFQKTFRGSNLPDDNWEDSDQKRAGNLGQLRKLKAIYDYKLHLSIGGWTWSKNFSLAMKTRSSRQSLVQSIIDFLETYPFFDGVDFDWEYLTDNGVNHGNAGNNVDPKDAENFIEFIYELRARLIEKGRNGFILGMCAVAAPEKVEFPVEKIHPLLDEIRIMTYDFAGGFDLKNTAHHTNARKSRFGKWSVEQAADYFLSRGVPGNKLLIGVAYYSRGYEGITELGQEATGNSPDFQFAEEIGIVPYHQLPLPGAVEIWDDEAKAHYSYDAAKKIINTYDTVDSVVEKCKIVKEKGLKGIIVWESAGEKGVVGARNLTSAMSRELNGTTTSPMPSPVIIPPKPSTPVTPKPSVPAPPSTEKKSWKVGTSFELGEIVEYNGKLYKALTKHVAHSPGWTPSATPSLWVELQTPTTPTPESSPTPTPKPNPAPTPKPNPKPNQPKEKSIEILLENISDLIVEYRRGV